MSIIYHCWEKNLDSLFFKVPFKYLQTAIVRQSITRLNKARSLKISLSVIYFRSLNILVSYQCNFPSNFTSLLNWRGPQNQMSFWVQHCQWQTDHLICQAHKASIVHNESWDKQKQEMCWVGIMAHGEPLAAFTAQACSYLKGPTALHTLINRWNCSIVSWNHSMAVAVLRQNFHVSKHWWSESSTVSEREIKKVSRRTQSK